MRLFSGAVESSPEWKTRASCSIEPALRSAVFLASWSSIQWNLWPPVRCHPTLHHRIQARLFWPTIGSPSCYHRRRADTHIARCKVCSRLTTYRTYNRSSLWAPQVRYSMECRPSSLISKVYLHAWSLTDQSQSLLCQRLALVSQKGNSQAWDRDARHSLSGSSLAPARFTWIS